VAEQSHKEEMRAALRGDFARLRARQERGGQAPTLRVDPPQPVPPPTPDPPVTPTPEPSPLPAPEPAPVPTEPEPEEEPELDPAAEGLGSRLRSLFTR
jgi:hypothetical protein